MNYTLFFLPTLFQLGKEKSDDYMRNGQVPEKHEIVVSNPLLDIAVPTCPFCNLERCSPLDFCYVIKSRLFDTVREYCGSLSDLTTIIRDRLANHITSNACQPSVADLNTAYCWCQNTTSRETVEDQLRRVRIWRYASLKWHADREARKSSTKRQIIVFVVFLLFWF